MDDTSKDLTEAFYRGIKAHCSGDKIDHRIVAEVFHKACVVIRNSDLEDVLTWAPFIHVGV